MRVPEQPVILTSAQLADALATNQKTVQRWAKRGIIPSLRWGADYRFVLVEVLDALRRPAVTTPTTRPARGSSAGPDLDAIPQKRGRKTKTDAA